MRHTLRHTSAPHTALPMFAPVEAALGGVLIQIATTLYLALTGSTIGFLLLISEIWNLPRWRNADDRRLLFSLVPVVSGMALATAGVARWWPQLLPAPTASAALLVLVASAGALTGLGTRWGNGCTSGHMLNGLLRWSYRSFVATCVFFVSAVVTVGVAGVGLLLCADGACYAVSPNTGSLLPGLVGVVATAAAVCYGGILGLSATGGRVPSAWRGAVLSVSGIAAGTLFGLGLWTTGMVNRLTVLRFLSVGSAAVSGDFSTFDPLLSMIILACIVPNALVWHHITLSKRFPLSAPSFSLPSRSDTPPKFLLGNLLFGVGWGLYGTCPGPGLLSLVSALVSGTLATAPAVWYGLFLAGRYLGGVV